MSRDDEKILPKIAVDPTRKLINLVKEHPCLWDKTCHTYKEKYVKEKAWREIYDDISPFYIDQFSDRQEMCTQVLKKWYNIRDSYVKSLKFKANQKRCRPYIYADQLSFLDHVYANGTLKKKRKKSSTVKAHKSEDEEEDAEEEAQEEIEEVDEEANSMPWNSDVFVQLSEDALETPAKKTKYDISDSDDIVAVLAKLIQKEEDEDRAFFKSITPAVKKLSDGAKFEFRIRVMKLIEKLKHKDLVVCKVEREPDDESD